MALVPSFAHATEPCRSLTQQQFRAKVLELSDAIVIAAVENQNREGQPQQSTVRVLRSYKGNASGDIIIHDWLADEMPMRSYAKGDILLFFLKRQGADYALTDGSWKECEPSTHWVKAAGNMHPTLGALLDDKKMQTTLDQLMLLLYSNK